MSLYWLHFDSADMDSVKAYGPFENPEVHARFRKMYADDEDDNGYRRSVDELPPLPGFVAGPYSSFDDHESSTWIAVQADNLFLLNGFRTFAVQERDTFVVTDEVSRVEPILSE